MPSRRSPRFTGLFPDELVTDSFWIRETGVLHLPGLVDSSGVIVVGELLPSSPNDSTSGGQLGLELKFDGRRVLIQTDIPPGPFRFDLPSPSPANPAGHRLEIKLLGVNGGNFLAWLGRVTGLGLLKKWRGQALNRRLRVQRIEAGSEILFDFSNRASPWNRTIARRTLKVGLNLVGYFRAVLGIGESVRCAARAADAAQLPVALVELKLHTKNPQTDETYAARLQSDNPHPVNVFHLDAPASRDIDHHHGEAFRKGKYNVGYWAWELPEFPDAWMEYAFYFDEIWAPSRFAAEAIAQKVPVPVLTMPHAIAFPRPEGDFREKFGLPSDKYLFLFLYDLNSYSERKNPAAVIEAFRSAGVANLGAALVIKIHNITGNEADFEKLRAIAAMIPGTVLITRTLTRVEIYELESACDCFVSLHRSEGFGISVGECMYLGKPVISTNWSATAEFVDETCGSPVRYRTVMLERNHGPYGKGQIWAEPDVEHAGWWMRKLLEDRALGLRLGVAARVRMEENYSPAVIGNRYRRRLETIAGW